MFRSKRLVVVFWLARITTSAAFCVAPRSFSFTTTRLHITTSTAQSTTTTSSSTTKYIDSIRDIVDDYDVFLLDMWGVMHDGTRPYEGVLETIQQLKSAGKEMVILSNSSKRREDSVKALQKLGFEPLDFAQIITSGDISYRMLAGDDSLECDSWEVLSNLKSQTPPKVFVLGSGAGDVAYCESCGWTVAPLQEADLVMARGTFTIADGNSVDIHKKDDPERYERVLHESLENAASLKLPMLVSNPDKVRPDKGLPPMPGAIGDAYEALLGSDANALVKRIGKPFPEVYQLALQNKDPSKAVMIGDALETDVTGGTNLGIATVWAVNDGIHGPDIQTKETLEEGTMAVLQTFNEKDGTYAQDVILQPDYIVPNFRW